MTLPVDDPNARLAAAANTGNVAGHGALTTQPHGGIQQQGTTTARIFVAIVFDAVIVCLVLSIFLGIEHLIQKYWEEPPEVHAENVAAAKTFLSSHPSIPIVITSSTDGPFILGFFPLSYIFQVLHVLLLIVLGIMLIYDIVKIARGAHAAH